MAATNPASRGIQGSVIGLTNPLGPDYKLNRPVGHNNPYKAIGVNLLDYSSVPFLPYTKHHIRLLLWTSQCPQPIWSPACITMPDEKFASIRRRLEAQTGKKLELALVKTLPFRLKTHLNIVNIVAADYVNKKLAKVRPGVIVKMEYEPHTDIEIEYPILVERIEDVCDDGAEGSGGDGPPKGAGESVSPDGNRVQSGDRPDGTAAVPRSADPDAGRV